MTLRCPRCDGPLSSVFFDQPPVGALLRYTLRRFLRPML